MFSRLIPLNEINNFIFAWKRNTELRFSALPSTSQSPDKGEILHTFNFLLQLYFLDLSTSLQSA